jgi:PadR family transcriptional regulator PadR
MRFESQLLKGIAPAVVLEILSGGQMYGYELSQAIEQRSVKGKWEKNQSTRKRRYYSITSKGKDELAKQKVQLRELTAGLNLVFGGALAPA